MREDSVTQIDLKSGIATIQNVQVIMTYYMISKKVSQKYILGQGFMWHISVLVGSPIHSFPTGV